MTHIVAMAGSSAINSKSTDIIKLALQKLEGLTYSTKLLSVRDIPAEELIYGPEKDSPHLKHVVEQIERASAVIIATPIYKASYSGALKAFLDLLPQKALEGKVVLPLATGGSNRHLLAIDYALKPVLFALGATHVLSGLYISNDQVERDKYCSLILDEEALARFNDQVETLVNSLQKNVSHS